MVDRSNVGLIGLGIGFLGGVVFTLGFPPAEKAKIFQEPNQPKIIRVYRLGRDSILVEDANDPNSYKNLNDYLNTIPNKYDRDIKESEIKKFVGW